MDSVSSESWDVEVRRVYPNDGVYRDTFEGITDVFDDGIVRGEALKDGGTYEDEDAVTRWTCYFGYARKDEGGTEESEGGVVSTAAEVDV